MIQKKETPMVMFYLPEWKREKEFTAFCKSHGWHTRKLTKQDTNKSLGILMGKGKLPQMPREIMKASLDFQMPEVIVFSGFDNQELDCFLEEYKRAGLPAVSLKATLTPTNIHWTLYELIVELQKERMASMLFDY